MLLQQRAAPSASNEDQNRVPPSASNEGKHIAPSASNGGSPGDQDIPQVEPSYFYHGLGLCAKAIIIFGPVLSYYNQYSLITKTGSVGAFSHDICAILLFGQALRILFWFGKEFDSSLFIQSWLLIAIQLVLLRACVEAENKDFNEKHSELGARNAIVVPAAERNPSVISVLYFKNLWRWPTFRQYLTFFLYLVISYSLLYYVFFGPEMVAATGMLSNICDALVAFPQAYKNWKQKSVKNLSVVMIGLWFLGDLMKLGFYVHQAQPYQFILGGFMTVFMDTLVLAQFVVYKGDSGDAGGVFGGLRDKIIGGPIDNVLDDGDVYADSEDGEYEDEDDDDDLRMQDAVVLDQEEE